MLFGVHFGFLIGPDANLISSMERPKLMENLPTNGYPDNQNDHDETPVIVYRQHPNSMHAGAPDDPSHMMYAVINRHSYHGAALGGGMIPIQTPHTNQQHHSNFNNHMPMALRAANSLLPEGGGGEKCQLARKRHSIANLGSAGLSVASESAGGKMKSLRGGEAPIDHTMQQGADINSESPRAGSIASLASINSAQSQSDKHAPPNLQQGTPTVMGPGGMPLEGRVLVDPSTGQHYIVPAQPQGGLYFHPQPVYYPQPNHYGYFPPHMAQGYTGQPVSQYPVGTYAQSSARYTPHATPPQFRHAPFSPMTSHASSEDIRREHSNSNPDPHRYGDHPPQSPSMATKHQIAPFPYPQYGMQAAHRVSPPQPEDPGDPFRREPSRSSNEFNHQDFGFQRTGSQAVPSPGPQQNWWSPRNQQQQAPNTQKREQFETQTDVENSPKRQPTPTGAASDNEAYRRAQQQLEAQRPKAVRMDFDFTKPLPEEEEEIERQKQKQPQEKMGTAFTVTFEKEPKADSLSLQDAARKSGTGRRLLGRRAQMNQEEKPKTLPVTPTGTQSARPPNGEEGGASKHYLLNKLLQGPLSSGPAGGILSPDDTPQMSNRKDNDAVSEAGTFVIGAGESKAAAMMKTRIVGDSSDSDSDDSSSSDDQPAAPLRASSPRRTAGGVEGRSKEEDSSQLLKELIALKRAQSRPTSAASELPPLQRLPSHPSTSQQPSTISPTHRGRQSSTSLTSPQSATSSSNQRFQASPRNNNHASSHLTTSINPNFRTSHSDYGIAAARRGDGGRFSMRTAQPSPQTAKRPPFRTGLPANNRPPPPNPHVVAQREQEMTAWLRRKDYNPMKAVQEAKKAQQQKQRADTFISNRSISFHVGGNKQPLKRTSSPGQSLSRNKSDESLAYEGASTASASQRVIAEYSRGVVKDINRLTERSRNGGEGKELSGLARAVDLLSTKCKKSIELIRSQNKGCLSVSVEDLLATAVEPPHETESLAEQLERLSDAFDAVQRYLEQYSLDGRGSPLPEDDEEHPETSSLVSGFSSMGLRGKPRMSSNVTTGSLVGGRDPAAQARAQRTTAYRSKLLAQQRDSSQTRLGKNN